MMTLQAYESLNPLAEMSKGDLKILSDRQVAEILESGSAEQAFAFLFKIKTLCENVIDGIKESAINEIEKGNDSAFGIKLKKMGKTTYDYSNDLKHVGLKAELSSHEAMLKALKGKLTVVDDETGEITTYYPPIKKVSDYIKTEY
jgi:hypothetical protein